MTDDADAAAVTPPVTEFDRDAALIKICASELGDSFIVTPAYPLLWCYLCHCPIRPSQRVVIIRTPISSDSFAHEAPSICSDMMERARRGGKADRR